MSLDKSKKFGPIKDNRSFKKKVIDFLKSLLFWKGKRKGMIHTMNIKWDHIRAVFFPKNFYEKYQYLGAVPWNEEGDIFMAIEPLVIFMDYKAKPWWCPRVVLRFLHLFGDDNSIVRVRNRTLSNLKRKLTKDYMIWDYKTKWHHYDLRISVSGTQRMQDLADDIEARFYNTGRREHLAQIIKDLDPFTKFDSSYSVQSLEEEHERLLDIKDNI
jgi:hypothetical protein